MGQVGATDIPASACQHFGNEEAVEGKTVLEKTGTGILLGWDRGDI